MDIKRGTILGAVLLLLAYLLYSLFISNSNFSANIVNIDSTSIEASLERILTGLKPGEKYTYSNVPVSIEVGLGSLTQSEAESADGVILSELNQDLSIAGKPVLWFFEIVVPENWKGGEIKITFPENAVNVRFEDRNGIQPEGLTIKKESLMERFFASERNSIIFAAHTGNYKVSFSTYPAIFYESEIDGGKINIIENSGQFDYKEIFVSSVLNVNPGESVLVVSSDNVIFDSELFDVNNDGLIESVRYVIDLPKFSQKVFYILVLKAADYQINDDFYEPLEDFKQIRNVDAVALSPVSVRSSELPPGCETDSLLCGEFSVCGLSSEDAFESTAVSGRQSRICVAEGKNCPVIIEDSRNCVVGSPREINVEAVAFAPPDDESEIQLNILDEETGIIVAEILLSGLEKEKARKLDIIFTQE